MLPGGALVNRYQGQTGLHGAAALPGLIFVGDAVCTTTPIFGRGVTTSLLQARELVGLLDQHGTDVDTAAVAFGAWCEVHMRPWVEDHVRMDEATRRRWAGEDIDLSRRLPSDLIMAAARVDPHPTERPRPGRALRRRLHPLRQHHRRGARPDGPDGLTHPPGRRLTTDISCGKH